MLRTARVLFGALLIAVMWGPQAGAQTGPSCQTFDANNVPATLFLPSDQIIVSGQGFPSDAPVKVDYLQATLVPQLATLRTDSGGGFATTPVGLPADAYAGSASIRAAAGGTSATCAIELAPRPIEAAAIDTKLVVVWGSVLFAGALVLTVIIWRRWRASRLAAKVERKQPISLLVPRPSSTEEIDVDEREPETISHVEDEREEVRELEPVGASAPEVSSAVARLMEATKSWSER